MRTGRFVEYEGDTLEICGNVMYLNGHNTAMAMTLTDRILAHGKVRA